MLLLGIALPVLLILLILSALIWIPHWFLGNETFRQEMNRQTNTALKLDGEWMPFRLDGWTLRSDGYDGSGVFESYRIHVRAEQLSFQINWRALLRRKWDIDPVEVQKLKIVITSHSEPASPPTPPTPPTLPPPPSFPKAAALFIPQTVDIREIILADTSVTLETSRGEKYQLNQIKAACMSDGHGRWSTAISSATFLPPQRLSWNLNSARLMGNLERMTLEHSEWFGKTAGIVKISGQLITDAQPDAELKLEGRGIPVASIVPIDWKSFFEGAVDGDATARFDLNGLELKGEATGKDIQLIGVPILRSMQLATGIREWTELPLNTAWAKFTYTDIENNHDLQIESSIFESSNLTRLEGDLRIRNNQLTGTYQVGLSPRVVAKIPGAEMTVFTLNQNGYHWAQPPMTLSGSMDDPKEDLSPRLKSAVFDAVEQKINEGVNRGVDLLKSLIDRVP